jgi:hypothetical protein
MVDLAQRAKIRRIPYGKAEQKMSEKNEVHIRYTLKKNFYRFEINYQKYKVAGFGRDLQEAEDKAQFALSGLPPHNMVHSIYECAKTPKKRKIKDEEK